MKKVLIIIFLTFFSFFLFSQSAKDVFLDPMKLSLSEIIDNYASDYSRIAGIYTSGGGVKGAASVGNFPSFRIGSHFGVILYTNPLNFIKKIKFANVTWDGLVGNLPSQAKDTINWFDSYFIPIPVYNYDIEMGVVHGLSFGGRFHIAPVGTLAKAVMPSIPTASEYTSYIKDILFWGLGLNLNYTFLKEYKYFPSISTGFGADFSQSTFGIDKIPLPPVSIDSQNPSIPGTIGFLSNNFNTSFYIDFTISKKFLFFQPFVNLKLIQTVNYNISKFNVSLDISKVTGSAVTLLGDGSFEVSNRTDKDLLGNLMGKITPVTDFVVSTGFELVMGIFRMGVSGTYGIVSERWLLSLDMRFQIEKWQFEKFSKKMNNEAVK